MSQIVDTWQALDLRRRVILVGAMVLTVAAVLSLAQIATRPGMALLYSGLDPAAAGEVVASLEQMGVKSDVRGDAIYVTEDDRDRVRLALAREGLPRQGLAGYELLDEISGFSATSDMFNAAYWRAKEGELARTIIASPGVRAARVHIAVPNRRPFARDGAQTTASVTVTMAGGSLTTEQATAIRYLVALAVPDLSPEQVAVIDSRVGMILSPGSESAAGSAANQAGEREAKLKREIEELLAARVGRDKARVSVAVETERAEETIVERIINPDSRVTLHADTEEISDNSQGAAGNVSVASNLPGGAAAADNKRTSARVESRERINYDYSETRRETVRQAGAIRRISVAVLVDGIIVQNANGDNEWQPRPADELESLRDLVIASIGYDEDRGDIVTVESMAFQPDAIPGALVEASPIWRFVERNALTLIQLVVLTVVALVLALTVVRPLLAPRQGARTIDGVAFGDTDGLAVGGETGMAGLPGPDGIVRTLEPGEEESEQPLTPIESLRALAADEPEKVTAMLRSWLDTEEDETKEEAA